MTVAISRVLIHREFLSVAISRVLIHRKYSRLHQGSLASLAHFTGKIAIGFLLLLLLLLLLFLLHRIVGQQYFELPVFLHKGGIDVGLLLVLLLLLLRRITTELRGWTLLLIAAVLLGRLLLRRIAISIHKVRTHVASSIGGDLPSSHCCCHNLVNLLI